MSYRKKHIKSKIQSSRPKKSILKKIWFWILLLLIAIISAGVYFLFFYPGLNLKNIVISGASRINGQDLQRVVSEDANTGLINFWGLEIVSRNILAVDTVKMNKDILEKFPDIEKLSINKKLPQTLTLGIIERKPLGVFCTDANKCYFIDNNGIIFEPLSVVPPDTTVVRQAIQNGSIFAGEEVVAQNIINAIYQIQKTLKDNFKIDVNNALITSPVRLNIKTSENWQIYFDLGPDSDINAQLSKLNSILNGGISRDNMNNLKYIDLRPKDRAIICNNATCGGQ